MENTPVKAPFIPHSFVQESVNVPEYMRIAPEVNPPVDLESLILTLVKGFRSWLENDRQKTIETTIYKLASLGLLTMTTPIDPLAVALVPQPVVLPGPTPIEIPPVVEKVPPPVFLALEPKPAPELVAEATDFLEESHPVPVEPDPRLAQPQPLEISPPPAPKEAKGKKVKGEKKPKKKETPEELERKKKLFRIRKNFQQHNHWLKKHGKPTIPQPESWDLLLNQKDEAPETDASPSGSEDG
jgi:hypothetical protein